MAVRALLLPYLVGLAASGLALSGCGDDGSSSGTQGASGSTTQDPTAGSTNTPTTDNPTSNGTLDGTGTDTMSSATDSSGEEDSTTDGPPPGCPYEPVDGMPGVTLEEVGRGFDRPLLAIGHPTEPDRLFVVEQGGNVKILEPGETEAPADSFLFVDVAGASNTTIGAEFGLLGFAFHPDFPTDPRVYVSYNEAIGGGAISSVISEFTVSAGDPNAVDPASERVILEFPQPAGNHNGGMIMFGQDDGYLYIGFGDGGGGDDTFDTGRNRSQILAKILRIGVEPDGTPDNPEICDGCGQLGPFDYTIPADNPFVDDPAFAPEIYAWGVRNPWRFAQDSVTGDIYVGDVGQGSWEEISLIEAGADLGWSDMEGAHCFLGAPCDTSPGPNEVGAGGMTMPVHEYARSGGRCSVTGGAVYRSCEVPAWDGIYFFGDYCAEELYGIVWDGTTTTDLGVLLDAGEFILGNGWNAYGDVFITTVDADFGLPIEDGLVYRLAPAR